MPNFLTHLHSEIELLLGENTKILIYILVVIIILFVLSFFLIIYPKANEMQKQIIVTIQLLNMIPIEVISGINSIRNYLSYLSRK